MWSNPHFPADLVIFTEETLMENFIFCSVTVIFVRIFRQPVACQKFTRQEVAQF